jgi:predicted phosphodiesterase
MRNRFLYLTAIGLILPASCSVTDNKTKELIDVLQPGRPKRESQWGTLTDNIPNNIGNTFTSDPKTTRTITWQSTINSGEVIVGNILYPAASVPNDDNSYYFHRVDIAGLEPGKTYRFIAGVLDKYSPLYTFKTEDSNSSNDFSVIHITDPQIGTADKNKTDAEAWKQVIETAIAKFPDAAFVVDTGDVVDNIKETRIPFYFDYAQEILAKYAFVYSLGNNDSLDWYDRYFYITGNRNKDDSGVLYSFDYGNTHFISINVKFGSSDDDVDSDVPLSDGQMTWLKNDLKNTSKKWKVVMTHKPEFGRKSKGDAKTEVTKLFDQYNVNLVIAGHYHFYARSKPIDWAGDDKKNGTVWTIPNAAGTKFNGVSGRTYLARDEQPELPMFSIIRFTDTNIELKAYTVDSNGNAVEFDSYQVQKAD